MAKFNLELGNRTGFDGLIADVSTTVPSFIPFLLAFVFFTIWIVGYRQQRISSGTGDAPLWGTIAGVITSSVALLMTLTPGIINSETLIITFVVTIAMGLVTFFSKDTV